MAIAFGVGLGGDGQVECSRVKCSWSAMQCNKVDCSAVQWSEVLFRGCTISSIQSPTEIPFFEIGGGG